MERVIKIYELFFLLTLLGYSHNASSQNICPSGKSSGIYLSKEDFIKNRISSCVEQDKSNGLEQKLDEVILTRDGKKYKLAFGTFYGYYKDGSRYRAYSSGLKAVSYQGYYKIESDSNIFVYSKLVYTPKTNGRTWYYYSETLDSPMKRLTIKNMRKDFAGQPEYISAAKNFIKIQPNILVHRLQ